jgi:hypothetical protein
MLPPARDEQRQIVFLFAAAELPNLRDDGVDQFRGRTIGAPPHHVDQSLFAELVALVAEVERTVRPSSATIGSPSPSPAASAGLSETTCVTRSPRPLSSASNSIPRKAGAGPSRTWTIQAML